MDQKIVIQAVCLAVQIVLTVLVIVLNSKTEKRIDEITERIKRLYGRED